MCVCVCVCVCACVCVCVFGEVYMREGGAETLLIHRRAFNIEISKKIGSISLKFHELYICT